MRTESSNLISPDLFPKNLFLPDKKIFFCHMTADNYERSPFLDHRIIKSSSKEEAFDIHELLKILPDRIPSVTHFVFHNAFCGSTLFARCLNAAKQVLVLREPNILVEVASIYRYRGTQLLPSFELRETNDIFRLVYFLLSRRYPENDVVIIKPSDACNNIMGRLLSANPSNKCLLIYSDLEHFLVSILKLPQRIEWLKVRANELWADELRAGRQLPVNVQLLSNTKIAACLWVLQIMKMRNLVTEFGENRVCSINSEKFMSSQSHIINTSLRFLGIQTDPEITNIHVKKITQTHSKASNLAFNNEDRGRDFRILREKLASEVESGIAWANNNFGESAITGPGNPLSPD